MISRKEMDTYLCSLSDQNVKIQITYRSIIDENDIKKICLTHRTKYKVLDNGVLFDNGEILYRNIIDVSIRNI